MTRVLVTGAGGQLGRDLLRTQWCDDTKVIGMDRAGLDITDRDATHRTLDRAAPDIVVNAAAYTKVDQAETEPELADAVNADGVGHLATWVARADARLIHISTDYVFDGTKDGWYVEADPIAPLGVYGRSKAKGEDLARTAERHVILRTAWVYAAHGNNFVRTMRRLGAERSELRVVADQVGCPSATLDLAAAIATLVGMDEPSAPTGTFHLASPTQATWHEFAAAILADRVREGLTLHAITTAEYPTPAARPANSRLSSAALTDAAGIGLRPWDEALADVVRELDLATEGTTS